MKIAEFNALNTYTTLAQIAVLPTDTKFFFGAEGPYPRLTDNTHGKQANNTALRHMISYCVKDTSTTGYHYVNDILESDVGTQESKTPTRQGLTTVVTRDDDDRRIVISDPDWA